jgi:PAS domain S-box-containing protein
MRKRLVFGSGLVLLAILVTLLVWQGSFTFGPLAPSSLEQTYVFWALSTIIFILTITLGFMLFRTFVKLYIERQANRTGSHIRSKLVGGALALSFLPVLFLVLWSFTVLNYNLARWFSIPGQHIKLDLVDVGQMIDGQMRDKLRAQGHWMELLLGAQDRGVYQRFCAENHIDLVQFRAVTGNLQTLCGSAGTKYPYSEVVETPGGTLLLSSALPVDLAAKKRDIDRSVADYNKLSGDKNSFRNLYLLLLSLITLFILFFATWLARYMANQISTPITALLNAAEELRKGNLGYRVNVAAIDELATLVRAFNEMSVDLDTNSKELEARRRFTEAILESIPTGVISLSGDGQIQKVNGALSGIFSEAHVRAATRLENLFPKEDAKEVRYLMNRARRTGVAATQLEFTSEGRVLHLSLTVAAIDERGRSGFVLVVEDTSELLRAQKAVAWNEVARRVAHEIKNPLTPIALCADRIARHLDRNPPAPDTQRILRECSTTISREVESVKTLVDEFSQFTRFPAAHPVAADLNEVIENALSIFAGRLDGIEVTKELGAQLPAVNIDRDQFKRVVVNLVDNAAEAMQNTAVKHLYIATRAAEDECVELTIADTGCGISREDKEKLFLPYFSTKGRGTGLGLAIVNRILSDHEALIRVEDNAPGARFTIEIPTFARQQAQNTEPAEVPA